MYNNLSPIINASELFVLNKKENMIIVHAGSGVKAKEIYSEKHLKDALYVDLDTDLSDIKDDASNGGRHPLPTPVQFSTLLSNLGISQNSHIVIYDIHGGANSSARFWWMLRSAGHEKVHVLNGGFKAAEKEGYSLNSVSEKTKTKTNFKTSKWKLPIADIDEVENASFSNTPIIIDVRSKERYQGLEEPIDLIAGHIPNAINIPFTENLNENGLFQISRITKINL